jgi:hypothetical protein
MDSIQTLASLLFDSFYRCEMAKTQSARRLRRQRKSAIRLRDLWRYTHHHSQLVTKIYRFRTSKQLMTRAIETVSKMRNMNRATVLKGIYSHSDGVNAARLSPSFD